MIAAFVILTNVPLIVDAFVPADVPVIPTTDGADHEYNVPTGTVLPPPFDGVTPNVPPEHIVAVCDKIVATGLTVYTNVVAVPEQPLNVGVTVIVPDIVVLKLFVAVNTPILPDPVDANPIAVLLFDQLKTVPLTLPVNVTPVVRLPAHNTWLDTASTLGRGFTVTVTVNVAPEQLPDSGVTV